MNKVFMTELLACAKEYGVVIFLENMPMTGCVNWDKVCAAIKEIGYSGVFSLECYAATALPTEDLYIRLSHIYFEVAKHLVEKI